MLYKDIYTGEIFTREALQSEYEALRASGDTEAETFSEYIKNCTDKDGTLVEGDEAMKEMEVFSEDYEQISELSDLYCVSDAQIVYVLLEIVKREKLIDKIKDYV